MADGAERQYKRSDLVSALQTLHEIVREKPDEFDLSHEPDPDHGENVMREIDAILSRYFGQDGVAA